MSSNSVSALVTHRSESILSESGRTLWKRIREYGDKILKPRGTNLKQVRFKEDFDHKGASGKSRLLPGDQKTDAELLGFDGRSGEAGKHTSSLGTSLINSQILSQVLNRQNLLQD